MLVEMLREGRRVRLAEPFSFTIDGELLTIPKGFITDFASVPRFFWRICPPWGRSWRAATIHDFLYSIGYPRERADLYFKDAMMLDGVPWWRREMMFRAVRVFGGDHWTAPVGPV